MSTRRHVLAAALALLPLVGAGCGPDASVDTEAGELRILSLTPNITEVLFAMGLGDRIVGRSTYCRYPPEVRDIPAVGDTLRLDVEQAVALEPTHAFLITGRPGPVERLASFGIRAVPLESDTMPELLESIRIVGRETGRTEEADALIDRIGSELDAVRRRVRGLPRPRTLFAFPMTVGQVQIMVAGRGTFVDELLEVAGAENAFGTRREGPLAKDWPTVGPEQIIEMAPEVVIVHAADMDPDSEQARSILQAWANWDSVPAVADGRVHLLAQPFLTIPGPRVGRAASILAETIHPELAEGGPS